MSKPNLFSSRELLAIGRIGIFSNDCKDCEYGDGNNPTLYCSRHIREATEEETKRYERFRKADGR